MVPCTEPTSRNGPPSNRALPASCDPNGGTQSSPAVVGAPTVVFRGVGPPVAAAALAKGGGKTGSRRRRRGRGHTRPRNPPGRPERRRRIVPRDGAHPTAVGTTVTTADPRATGQYPGRIVLGRPAIAPGHRQAQRGEGERDDDGTLHGASEGPPGYSGGFADVLGTRVVAVAGDFESVQKMTRYRVFATPGLNPTAHLGDASLGQSPLDGRAGGTQWPQSTQTPCTSDRALRRRRHGKSRAQSAKYIDTKCTPNQTPTPQLPRRRRCPQRPPRRPRRYQPTALEVRTCRPDPTSLTADASLYRKSPPHRRELAPAPTRTRPPARRRRSPRPTPIRRRQTTDGTPDAHRRLHPTPCLDISPKNFRAAGERGKERRKRGRERREKGEKRKRGGGGGGHQREHNSAAVSPGAG